MNCDKIGEFLVWFFTIIFGLLMIGFMAAGFIVTEGNKKVQTDLSIGLFIASGVCFGAEIAILLIVCLILSYKDKIKKRYEITNNTSSLCYCIKVHNIEDNNKNEII